MVLESTLTSKGQTTIPAEIRAFLKAKTGDKLRYVIRDGEVVLKAKTGSIMDLVGFLHDPARKPMSVEEMDEAMEKAVADHVMGKS
jgi:AbrB family looped-hinge helix DNA binding protein